MVILFSASIYAKKGGNERQPESKYHFEFQTQFRQRTKETSERNN